MAVKARFRRNFLSLQRPQSLIPEVPIDKSIKPSQIYVNRLEPLMLESEYGRGDGETRGRNAKTPNLAPRRVGFKTSGRYGNDHPSDADSLLFSFPAKHSKLKIIRSASTEKRLGLDCPRCKESRSSFDGVPAQLVASHALATPNTHLIRAPSLRASPFCPSLPTPTRNLTASPSPFTPTKRSFSPFTLREPTSLRNEALFPTRANPLSSKSDDKGRKKPNIKSIRNGNSRISLGEIGDILFLGREKTHKRR